MPPSTEKTSIIGKKNKRLLNIGKPIYSLRGAYASPEAVARSESLDGRATNPSFEESRRLESKYGIGGVPTTEIAKALKIRRRKGLI